jgi:hypothetical protein
MNDVPGVSGQYGLSTTSTKADGSMIGRYATASSIAAGFRACAARVGLGVGREPEVAVGVAPPVAVGVDGDAATVDGGLEVSTVVPQAANPRHSRLASATGTDRVT